MGFVLQDKESIVTINLKQIMELKDFKDVVRAMTKEEFESAINEDIKFVERFKHFLNMMMLRG